MFASQVMCAAAREGNTSHHFGAKPIHHYAVRHNITDLRSKSTSLFTNYQIYVYNIYVSNKELYSDGKILFVNERDFLSQKYLLNDAALAGK